MLWDFANPYKPRVIPAWICQRDLSRVRINERLRKSVMFIGIVDDTGAFAPYGTAFAVSWKEKEYHHLYMVTAKHVLDSIKRTKRPAVGRLNTKSGGVEIGSIPLDLWDFHPDNKKCDIAVTPISASQDTFDFLCIDLKDCHLTDEYISDNDVGPGDEVFTVGLLTRHFGSTRNVPIVRTGNIAAMPEEPVDLGEPLGSQEVYLIEGRSIGGLSGSPVFLNTPPFRLTKDSQIIGTGGHYREYIIGVNIGLFKAKAIGDSLPSTETERREHFLEDMSAGIAIVIPIQRVIEIIDSPEFRRRRKALMAKFSKDQSFVPTSAGALAETVEMEAQVEPALAHPDNPSHREDFTRLVSVAAKSKPKGGRT